ncbi:MAG TPA: fasciclin domain-containing protein [Candidatus Polarisedimenticolia bacterium]|nr:fasciclin domain-containing protein [Candidatus Polarisedimenticolia bacterium]
MSTVKHALKDIPETVADLGAFRSFCAALKAAGLTESLKGKGPFTVFAPTDEAFAKLGESVLQDLLKPQRRGKLRAILNYHVLQGSLLAAELVKSSSTRTVQGTGLTIHFKNNRMHVNNAMVLQADIACENGVVHVLDTVVIPR